MLYFMLLVTLWVNQKITFHQQWNVTSHRNVQKFIYEIQQVDWQIVTEIREPQVAYTQFHNVISKTYDKCFPYKRYKSGYATKEPWITTAIRESIKTKK